MTDDSAATSGHDAPSVAATAPITVEQAAAALGVSVTTVKRRIRSGALRAEQARRAQGTVWLVYLPAAATVAATDERPSASVAATTAATVPAPAEAMVSLIQTTIATVLGPLVAELAASRETIAAHGETISHQAETIGRLRAELDAAKSTLTASTAPEMSAAPSDAGLGRSWTSARWAWVGVAILAVLVLAIGLAALLH